MQLQAVNITRLATGEGTAAPAVARENLAAETAADGSELPVKHLDAARTVTPAAAGISADVQESNALHPRAVRARVQGRGPVVMYFHER